jgi:hypothetical protein
LWSPCKFMFKSTWKSWKFWIFLKFCEISEFSLIDDEVRVFRINIKLLSNPVAELKIRETLGLHRLLTKTLKFHKISKIFKIFMISKFSQNFKNIQNVHDFQIFKKFLKFQKFQKISKFPWIYLSHVRYFASV